MYNKFFFDLLKKICYNIYVKKKKGKQINERHNI